MPNQYVNKVVQSDGTTLIDITDTTAVASDVAQGKYFYLATGEKVQGSSSGGGTPAISVVDTTDTHGGTIREITALDISDTTAVASVVQQGYYFYTAQGVKTAGTASGGTPSATAHTIYFEFSDSTNTTITAYYDDSFISDAITATTPTTYGQKTVTLAQLDGVTWYSYNPTPVSEWETIFNDTVGVSSNNYGDGTGYVYLSELSNVPISDGSEWRITIDGHSHVGTAQYYSQINTYGVPYNNSSNTNTAIFYNSGQAWLGYMIYQDSGAISLKIERPVTS